MTLPAARVVRQGGIEVVPPPVPWAERMHAAEQRMSGRTRAVLGALIGLWPVTAVVALAGGLLSLSLSGGP